MLKTTDNFLKIIEQHKGIIYKIVNAYCKNEEDRKDIAQEIILQLWKSFGNYNAEIKFTTWMYRIALNVAISFYRKDSVRKAAKEYFALNIFQEQTIDFAFQQDEKIKWLYQFINELPAFNKALLLLYLDQKSHKEIAEIMGITETNVATKISRIKQQLREKFSNI